MTVQLSTERKGKLKNACQQLVEKDTCTIQNLAEVIGLIVSSLPGVEYGPLHYRNLERNKTDALRENKGNFRASMTLSPEARLQLHWWLSNVDSSFRYISHGKPVCHIQTDASSHGWGGVRGNQRTPEEAAHHINYLELLAILLTLKALCWDCANSHIQVQCDNTTAVCYINNMGGSKSLNRDWVTRQIWDYCINHNIWLSATHLPGCENTVADTESRHFNDRTEWMLDPNVYSSVVSKFGNPTVDLFK